MIEEGRLMGGENVKVCELEGGKETERQGEKEGKREGTKEGGREREKGRDIGKSRREGERGEGRGREGGWEGGKDRVNHMGVCASFVCLTVLNLARVCVTWLLKPISVGTTCR